MQDPTFISYHELKLLAGHPDQKKGIVGAIRILLKQGCEVVTSNHSLGKIAEEFSKNKSHSDYRDFHESVCSLVNSIYGLDSEDILKASDLCAKFGLTFDDALDCVACQKGHFLIHHAHPGSSIPGMRTWR